MARGPRKTLEEKIAAKEALRRYVDQREEEAV